MERCMEPKLKHTFTEEQATKFAELISGTLVVRRYKDGNSSDTRQDSTQGQATMLASVIVGALIAIGNGCCKDSVMKAAEFIFLVSPYRVLMVGL